MAEEYSKKDVIKKAIGKVALVDAGMPSKFKGLMASCSSPCKEDENKKSYPTMYLDAQQAAFLSEYEVGDELTFVVKAKVIGRNANESEDYKCDEYRLEIRKVGKPE